MCFSVNVPPWSAIMVNGSLLCMTYLLTFGDLEAFVREASAAVAGTFIIFVSLFCLMFTFLLYRPLRSTREDSAKISPMLLDCSGFGLAFDRCLSLFRLCDGLVR